MRILSTQPTRVDQVYEAILAAITEGRLAPNARLIQDELARTLGVSRQPVQQALLLLRSHGFVREAPGRGLIVTPIDIDFVRDLYEIRSVLEGLAARRAAERGAQQARRSAQQLIEQGRAAVRSGSVGKMIAADTQFHRFVYEISGNTLIRETTSPHWHHLTRAMAMVLLRDDDMPEHIWQQHEAIAAAIAAGDGEAADRLARAHITNAAAIFVARLRTEREAREATLAPPARASGSS